MRFTFKRVFLSIFNPVTQTRVTVSMLGNLFQILKTVITDTWPFLVLCHICSLWLHVLKVNAQ